MKNGQLISLMTSALGLESGQVRLTARLQREAGLMTSGARGTNAPSMTPMDATRLLLGLVIADRPTLAVAAIRDFGTMPFRAESNLKSAASPETAAYVIDPAPTLEQMIERVLRDLMNGSQFDAEIIVFISECIAIVRVNDRNFEYSHYSDLGSRYFINEKTKQLKERYFTNIKISKSVDGDVIEQIVEAFSGAGNEAP